MNLDAVLNSFVREPTTDKSAERKRAKSFAARDSSQKNREEILS